MKTLPLITAALAVALSSCAHKAQHFAAPNAAPLQTASHKLSVAVVESREAVKQSSEAVTKASKSHNAEAKRLMEIEPQIDDLLTLAPAELKPAVAKVQLEVTNLKAEQGLTTQSLNEALAAQAVASGKLEEANAAKNEVEKLSPAYFAQVDKLAEKANASEQGWAKDSAALQWYRVHWLISWLVLGSGVALAGLWAFAKFTVRGAALAARF